MSNAAIVIEGLSKAYQRGKIRRPDIRGSLAQWWQQTHQQKEFFFALQDIDLVIEQGDVLGIVGPNGAGKSTLLKLLSRISFPTKGRIAIRGTLSSMLEVGTGFHPELSGRENIFLNGALIGMSREEVNRKLDSIIAFSGIEPFLDTPVKHYSSGMYVRLAFSVTAHLEPDIFLIDEVLAVGDQEFKKKCLDKLMDVSNQGRTILMVSHQMSYLKELCTKGIFINAGKLIYTGTIDDTLNQYVNYVSENNQQLTHTQTNRRGNGRVMISSFALMDENRSRIVTITTGQHIILRFDLQRSGEIARNIVIQVEFYDLLGHLWFVCNNSISDSSLSVLDEPVSMECHIPKFPLNVNSYTMNVAVYVENQLGDEIKNVMFLEVLPGAFYPNHKLPPQNKGLLVEYQWKERK